MAGIFLQKNDEGNLELDCFALNYGDRTIKKEIVCSFSKEGIPDRPFLINNVQAADLNDFCYVDFDYDNYINVVDYSNFGMQGKLSIEFGHGLSFIKMMNAFPVGYFADCPDVLTEGTIMDDNELFEKISLRDLAVAEARDKYAEDMMFHTRVSVDDVRKSMASYAELLQQEYSSRKSYLKHLKYMDSRILKTSSMKKEDIKLKHDVDSKCSARRNFAGSLGKLMDSVREAYFAYDMLARSSQGDYSKMMRKIALDFKNIIVLDIVRRRSLGRDAPGGAKFMLSINSARNISKHCRRLNCFISYSTKNYFGYNVSYIKKMIANSSSAIIIEEKRKRFVQLFEAKKFAEYGAVDSSSHPSVFYKAQYLYFLKLFNERKIATFNDKMIVQRMMKAGYSDEKILLALKSVAVDFVGKPNSEINALIANCRIRHNEMLCNDIKFASSRKNSFEKKLEHDSRN